MARRPAVDFSVDARQFVDLFGKTSQVDNRLRLRLRRELKASADEAARAVQQEVLLEPLQRRRIARRKVTRSSQRASFGLRSGIAQGVKVVLSTSDTSSRVGVFIKATGRYLPPAQKPLVRAYNRKGGWRHPVFARGSHRRHAGVKVTQKGRPYFGVVIAKHQKRIAKSVEAAMKQALDSLK